MKTHPKSNTPLKRNTYKHLLMPYPKHTLNHLNIYDAKCRKIRVGKKVVVEKRKGGGLGKGGDLNLTKHWNVARVGSFICIYIRSHMQKL